MAPFGAFQTAKAPFLLPGGGLTDPLDRPIGDTDPYAGDGSIRGRDLRAKGEVDA